MVAALFRREARPKGYFNQLFDVSSDLALGKDLALLETVHLAKNLQGALSTDSEKLGLVLMVTRREVANKTRGDAKGAGRHNLRACIARVNPNSLITQYWNPQ